MSFQYKISILFIFISISYSHGHRYVDVAQEVGVDFSYLSTEYGGGISFVDFNQDGWDDLFYATQIGDRLKFFINNQTGLTLDTTLISDTSEVRQILWVDYNNDYRLDLFIATHGQNQLFRNDGDELFTDVSSEAGLDSLKMSTYCSSWIDYDHDGRLDLFVTHRDSFDTGHIDLYRNVDSNTFEKRTIEAGFSGLGNSVLAMTTLDYNNDG